MRPALSRGHELSAARNLARRGCQVILRADGHWLVDGHVVQAGDMVHHLRLVRGGLTESFGASWVKAANQLARRTAGELGYTLDDILSYARDWQLSRARQAVYLKLSEAGYGYAAIGRLLGRHHTTIMHGCEQARRAGLKEAS